MSQPLRVGVIGLGSVAQNRHLPEFAAHGSVIIAAVADPDVAKAARIATAYPGCRAYADFREMLAEANLHAVAICAPNHIHAPAALLALQRGLHVLCEKPMATNLEDAQAMLDAAAQSGTTLMMAHNQRFDAVHRTARALVQDGRIGRVLSFRSYFGTPGPDRWQPEGLQSWFFQKAYTFAGALADLGAHKVDLLPWLIGAPITLVAALTSNSGKGTGVDDNAALLLRLQNGAVGTIQASWTHTPRVENATVLYGETGKLRILDDPTCELVLERDQGREEFRIGRPSSPLNPIPSGVIDHFVACVRSGEQPAVTGADGYTALRVLLAACTAAETGRAIEL